MSYLYFLCALFAHLAVKMDLGDTLFSPFYLSAVSLLISRSGVIAFDTFPTMIGPATLKSAICLIFSEEEPDLRLSNAFL